MKKDILFNFTKALSSAISLAENEVKDILPNLYITNKSEDRDLELISSLDYPEYYPHAYGEYLDRLGYQFKVSRQIDEDDESYRKRIIYSIIRSVTINGLKSSVRTLFEVDNIPVDVRVVESYKNSFDGTTTSLNAPIRSSKGTLLYGVSIIVTPTNLKQRTMHVENPTGYIQVEDGEGNPIITEEGLHKVLISSDPDVVFNKYKNIYYRKYLDAFSVKSFRELLHELVAAGIKIEKAIIKQPGSGGSKGETYVN